MDMSEKPAGGEALIEDERGPCHCVLGSNRLKAKDKKKKSQKFNLKVRTVSPAPFLPLPSLPPPHHRAMSRSAHSARNRTLLAAAAFVLAGAATAYFYFTSGPCTGSSPDSHAAAAAAGTAQVTPQNTVKSKRNIAVLVTQQFLEDGLPISLLLVKYPNAVLLLAPDLVDLAHPRLRDQVPASERYRLIRCETYKGALHVLKHLRPALALIPPVEICGIGPGDLDHFVQQTELISDESVARLLAS
jgi:hypothetical protein